MKVLTKVIEINKILKIKGGAAAFMSLCAFASSKGRGVSGLEGRDL